VPCSVFVKEAFSEPSSYQFEELEKRKLESLKPKQRAKRVVKVETSPDSKSALRCSGGKLEQAPSQIKKEVKKLKPFLAGGKPDMKVGAQVSLKRKLKL